MPTTVILGTGVVGLSTAYYLSHLSDQGQNTPTPDNPTQAPSSSTSTPKERHHIHLVEPCPELFASASGKAAGFLAKDWFAPAVAPLGAFSFDLHRKLAKEHGGHARWGWSESVSYALDRDDSEIDENEEWTSDEIDDEIFHDAPEDVDGHEASRAPSALHTDAKSRTTSSDLGWLMDGSSRATLLDGPPSETSSGGTDELPRWLRAKKSALQAISDRATTGQVEPLRLCQFLLSECQARGVVLHQPARATQLTQSDPVDTSSQTCVRIQYLDESSAAALSGEYRTSTPNSVSPPSEVNNGKGIVSSTTPVNGGSMAHGSPATRSLRPSTNPSPDPQARGSWASFSTQTSGSGNSPQPADGDYFTADVSTKLGAQAVGADKDASPGAAVPNSRGYTGRTVDIPCDSIVIAAGCWTPRVYRTLFPNAGRVPRVTALAGHSVVVRSKRWPASSGSAAAKAPVATAESAPAKPLAPLPATASNSKTISPPFITPVADMCHAIFTGDHAGYSPEIFSRTSGDIWLGGLNSSALPLPPVANGAVVDPKAIDTLLHTARALCGHDVEVVRTGLCFRPVAPTGRPVLARMHEADLGDGLRVNGGVFVATGHGPWGISLSLGTGYVVSEMVLGKQPSVDVKSLGMWEAQAP